MEIYKDFTFEAAHRLPNVPQDHKCARLHGHSFSVRITLNGPIDEKAGWVMDFAAIEKAFAPALAKLDHNYLNEIEGLQNPTSENIARWIWREIEGLEHLQLVEVRETCTSGCSYWGDE